MPTPLPRYAVIDKKIGETPLQALERYRADSGIAKEVPLAYAGRLDPLASGTLLILIGDECKNQTAYHKLDKVYQFSVLFGVSSDTYDPLGRLAFCHPPPIEISTLRQICHNLQGTITLPYPPFSAKTVNGKPLHTWALEGRLSEITIPVQTSKVYRLQLKKMRYMTAADIYKDALSRIDSIQKVTDPKKALGADFRRADVCADWEVFLKTHGEEMFPIADLHCITSSGTYMRSLAQHLGEQLNVPALAFSIHRSKIGRYQKLLGHWGIFTRQFRHHS